MAVEHTVGRLSCGMTISGKLLADKLTRQAAGTWSGPCPNSASCTLDKETERNTAVALGERLRRPFRRCPRFGGPPYTLQVQAPRHRSARQVRHDLRRWSSGRSGGLHACGALGLLLARRPQRRGVRLRRSAVARGRSGARRSGHVEAGRAPGLLEARLGMREGATARPRGRNATHSLCSSLRSPPPRRKLCDRRER